MKSWHLADLENRMYCTTSQHQKIGMPRYYKDKLYTETQRKIVAYFALQKIRDRRNKYDHQMVMRYGSDASRVEFERHKNQFRITAAKANIVNDKL